MSGASVYGSDHMGRKVFALTDKLDESVESQTLNYLSFRRNRLCRRSDGIGTFYEADKFYFQDCI